MEMFSSDDVVARQTDLVELRSVEHVESDTDS